MDECALGLHDCSGVASCTDLANGYTCQCPRNFLDGNPENPGRICSQQLCGLCNGHGDCLHDAVTRNVTCSCFEGWGGTFCDEAAGALLAQSGLIVVIVLAILFLLLSLCCLLYFCLKCRCVKSQGLWYREPLFTYRRQGGWPWATLDVSTSSESAEGTKLPL